MKGKKIIALLISGVLVFSLIGCGKDSEKVDSGAKDVATEKTAKKEDKIKKDKDSIFALGKKQTQEVKSIVEKNGIKTVTVKDANDRKALAISKDENDSSLSDTKGYTTTTLEKLIPTNEKDNKYSVEYYSIVENGKSEGEYQYKISVNYPKDKQFKIEEAKMLKELIQVIDKNYDFGDFDKWVLDFLEKNKAGKAASAGRDHGAFHENLKGGIEDNKIEQRVTYTITLN